MKKIKELGEKKRSFVALTFKIVAKNHAKPEKRLPKVLAPKIFLRRFLRRVEESFGGFHFGTVTSGNCTA